MAQTPVEMTKAPPATRASTDPWQSLRTEMDRLFDRFGGSFGLPSLRRMFDLESPWRYETSFSFSAPAVDITEDDNAYKITAELPGMSEKDIDISISGDMLMLKGEKRQEREEREKRTGICRNGATARSSGLSHFPTALTATRLPPSSRKAFLP